MAKEKIKKVLVATLKILLPYALYRKVKFQWRFYKTQKYFNEAYLYDLERYLKYSDSQEVKSESNLIGIIVRRYHVIEKGLTMPQTRFGFGKQVLQDLVKDCLLYVSQFGTNEEQLAQAIAVIKEYKNFHETNKYSLDGDLLSDIEKIELLAVKTDRLTTSHQKELKREEYFKFTTSNFQEFSMSRASVRDYCEEEVLIDDILQALEIAKTAPSACNRQSWRTYVFSDSSQIQSILNEQGGNRGFGHLTNKLIVVASSISGFSGVAERNQGFIDGGIYAMNLLYSLHYKQIAACILNCSNTIEKDKNLRKLCNIKDSEVFIALISCGIPPENFKAAASIRYSLEKTNIVV